MTFNSVAFAIFLPIVFIFYWFFTNKNLKIQNLLLLAASYVFYGWWDWRFLVLLFAISLVNYFIGLKVTGDENDKSRLAWLRIGLMINIGVLCIFKYFNFFIDGFIDLISLSGYELPRTSLRIILPLGISFYTFLSISYIIDVYKNNIKAHKNLTDILLSLSFFPIILAGPIQRPATLLPQITSNRKFEYSDAVDGLKQILWGLFAKIVIADNLAPKIEEIFQGYAVLRGSTLLVGAGIYAIQIYADFSGYSNMAIGIGRLFGFSLMRNFDYPYFSRDISEFWKKWHMSLTTWFRDYIFLPLSFAISWKISSEKILFMKTDMFIYIVASIVTWFLTGLWHGANYTFIVWGMIHGLFLILHHWQKKPRKKLLGKAGLNNNNIYVVLSETFVTLSVVILAWIFFRSNTIQDATGYISGIFSTTLFTLPEINKETVLIILPAIIFIVIEWTGREYPYAICHLAEKKNTAVRWAFYYLLAFLVMMNFGDKGQTFIYFQF